jgi:pseudouridine kinase
MAYKISVIGGTNLDIGGRPSESLRLRDSNIGTISRSAGGVGFNIAKNLAERGTTVSLVSALGDD